LTYKARTQELFWTREPKSTQTPDRRLAPRVETCLDASILGRTGERPVIVSDISAYGASVYSVNMLNKKDEYKLTIEGLDACKCRVVWLRGNLCGCQFNSPLDAYELSTVLAQCARSLTCDDILSILRERLTLRASGLFVVSDEAR
jgi:hypothetical protein